MQEKALEIASHITHPVTVAAFALVFAAFSFALSIKAKKPRIAWLLAIAIMILGLAPLLASTFLESQGIYRVHIVVVGPDEQPLNDAEITTSIGGEIKKASGGWELDIPPQVRPADRKVTIYAVKDGFVPGSSTLFLVDDFYPPARVPLKALPEVMIRGIVTDPSGRSVAGARVSIPGYDTVISDEAGNFALHAHAPYGKMVTVHAEKGKLLANLPEPAGYTQINVKLHAP